MVGARLVLFVTTLVRTPKRSKENYLMPPVIKGPPTRLCPLRFHSTSQYYFGNQVSNHMNL
jgi:hypothetical protein